MKYEYSWHAARCRSRSMATKNSRRIISSCMTSSRAWLCRCGRRLSGLRERAMRPGSGAGSGQTADSRRLGDRRRAEDPRGGGHCVSARPDEMGRDVAKETAVSIKSTTRLVREGEFAAEVEVTLVEASGGWTPYLSLEDAYKLDDVRDALRAGDVRRASQIASRVYRLTPVEA